MMTTKSGLWRMETTDSPQWQWWNRAAATEWTDGWELRFVDREGNTFYVNMVWPNPDGWGWRFWDPRGAPGSAAYCWRPTLEWAKRSCFRLTRDR